MLMGPEARFGILHFRRFLGLLVKMPVLTAVLKILKELGSLGHNLSAEGHLRFHTGGGSKPKMTIFSER